MLNFLIATRSGQRGGGLRGLIRTKKVAGMIKVD